MKHQLFLIALSVIIVLFIAGCGRPLVNQYHRQLLLFNGTTESIITLTESGEISLEDYTTYVLPALEEANTALDEMGIAARKGEKYTFRQALDHFEKYIERLIAYDLKAREREGE